ncbi:MAG: AAA family ATPase [Deltaproteobacteria bacterium]|nr:AAA family ATPase [Deltaproteobacteria bacterium]
MKFRFRDLAIDPELRELTRAGKPVRVQPKVFEFLLYLVRNRERVVPREELLSAVWRDVAVTGASIVRALKEARRAIGEDGASSASIATRRGEGLRFVAAVEVEGGERSDYVGREALLADLRGAFDAARAGRGRIALLEGEAGIGKTRTLAELARWAREYGVSIASGAASSEAEAPAFWPWLQVLGALGVAPRSRPVPRRESAGAARYELFLEVRVALETALARGPLVLLLDDLHAADAGTLELLDALAPELEGRALLVAGAYRAEGVALAPPLARALARVRRHGAVSVLAVPRLSADEIARLVNARTERAPDSAAAEKLASLTRGNPLYVVEMLRASGSALAGGASAAQLAASLQRAIELRLAELSPATLAWLRLAALLGEELDAGVALLAGDAPRERLDEALSARVLERVAPGSERVRFVHALFREVLEAQLAEREREALHARIAAALRGRDEAELAHHLLGAGSAGDPPRGIALALRLAGEATALGATDRAANLLGRAAALLLAGARVPEHEAVQVWSGLADARHRLGDALAARAAGERALALARARGSAALLGAATLAYAGDVTTQRLPQPEIVALLREAIASVGEVDLALRAKLLARLHAEQRFAPHADPGGETLRAALAAARATGDPLTEFAIVDAPFSGLWESVPPAERLPLAERAIERAHAEKSLEWEMRARTNLLNELLARGDLARLREEFARAAAQAQEHGAAWIGYLHELCASSVAVVHADFERAEQAAQRALAAGRRVGIEAAALLAGSQMITLRIEQGRGQEVAGLLRLGGEGPPGPGTACLSAWLWAEAADAAAMRDALARVARDFGGRLARYGTPVANAACIARACWLVGDRALAEEARTILAPQRGRLAIRGVVTLHGQVTHALALTEAALGAKREARALLREARVQAAQISAPRWLKRIEVDAKGLA